MKRHAWFICLIVTVSVRSLVLIADESGTSLPEIDLKECKTLTRFYEIWKESLYGREPNRVERAAWIKQNGKGYEFVKWEMTTERQTISWRGALPEKVIAVVHTHPQKVDPKPSKEDGLVARRLNIPVYTISRKGIWKITPDRKVIQEAGVQWYKEVKENPCKESE
ncbi:hypothetical protein L0244_23030 [bacterium]|nr:hypothetical protein [bacterium]MCI0615869.1 hypothetical protein [bacterium]